MPRTPGWLPLPRELSGGVTLSILESSPDCIKLIELDGSLSFMSTRGLCAMEIDDFSQIRGSYWPLMWPTESRHLLEEAMAQARNGQQTEIEAFCPTARGVPRWWHLTIAPVVGPMGEVDRILASSRDVTATVTARHELEARARDLTAEVAAKEAALARQKVLVQEIDHRVKNSLAAVTAILRVQSRSTEDSQIRQAIQDAARRVATIARVHEQLHRDPGAASLAVESFISGLIGDLGMVAAGPIRFSAQGCDGLLLQVARLTALGQILAELIGNAVKHAGSQHAAHIDVTLDHDDGLLRLTVSDDGPGLPDGFDLNGADLNGAGGIGMRICIAYADELGGTFVASTADQGGARFSLTIPV